MPLRVLAATREVLSTHARTLSWQQHHVVQIAVAVGRSAISHVLG